MKRKRFSVEQIVAVLRQGEMRMPVVEFIRRLGMCEQTFYGRESVERFCSVHQCGFISLLRIASLDQFHFPAVGHDWNGYVSSGGSLLNIASVLEKMLIVKGAVAPVRDNADDHQEEKGSRWNPKKAIGRVTGTPNRGPDESQHGKKPVSMGGSTDKHFPARFSEVYVRGTEGSGKQRGTIQDEKL